MKCPNVKECLCDHLDCENHGRCCVCVKNHLEKDVPPYCLRKNFERKKPQANTGENHG